MFVQTTEYKMSNGNYIKEFLVCRKLYQYHKKTECRCDVFARRWITQKYSSRIFYNLLPLSVMRSTHVRIQTESPFTFEEPY